MVKQQLELALSRARYAAIGAAVGAGLGGLFNKNAASSGAAVGALVGATVGESRLSAQSRLDELRARKDEQFGDVLSKSNNE
ncbi:YMGG-like glycine zipper-containing protein [Natronococcus sp. A-GB1]|uniref:17 kDa surface antigen n=1 Tax=Natronococcus amylolyticus DSM 10524 TaxID=1227497 RepID=L9XHS6_9EURY|nr:MULTISPECIES: YMGG-like glycine zipper-containing protein [Natronococcus]ELY60956.1 17 kDa surface antigen [Natronococcus amylolyticus DSM 10524]MDG5760742.1 YMGG-like glycine zipper-containing protein [Natronococcus sp. A-GB1]